MFWIGRTVLLLGILVFPVAALAQARTDVEVGELSRIEPFSIRVLAPGQKALPTDQWQNSNALVLRGLLEELPVGGGSPVINDLLGRVLLSGGTPPAAQSKTLDKLTQLRLAGVYSLGHLAAVTQIAALSPGGHRDPELTAITIKALLALNRPHEACDIAAQLTEARGAAFWLQLRAFCLAARGNIAGAELTAELALSADPGSGSFLSSINRITTPDETPMTASPGTALELAMILMAKDTILSQNLTLALQAGVGGQKDLEMIEVLFGSFIYGAVSVGEMYERLLGHADQLENPNPVDLTDSTHEPILAFERELDQLKTASSRTGIDRIASLLTLGRNAEDSKIRAEALTLVLDVAPSYMNWLALNRLIAGEIRFLSPGPELKPYASVFVRTNLLAGNSKLANQWLVFVDSDDRQVSTFDALFWAGADSRALGSEFLRQMGGSEQQQNLLTSDLLAATALGKILSPKLRHWLSLQNQIDQQPCQYAKVLALTASAKSGALAETVLRASDLLRQDGFDTLSDICSAGIVAALQRVGLKDEARIAAMEWMLARRWEQ